MLARRLATILPDPILPEALDTTRIHRIAAVTTRPCRAPHHTISDLRLIGRGQVPMPGDVSLTHHNMRLLDARPECHRHVLEVLHPPLEESVLCIQSPERHKSL
jgi:magnesium chelatase family protein